MNPEAVKQIVETIKTLNLNIDSQTFQEVANKAIPEILRYFYFVKIMDIVKGLLVFGGLVIVVVAVIKIINKQFNQVK